MINVFPEATVTTNRKLHLSFFKKKFKKSLLQSFSFHSWMKAIFDTFTLIVNNIMVDPQAFEKYENAIYSRHS
jgi:hypothetical protein